MKQTIDDKPLLSCTVREFISAMKEGMGVYESEISAEERKTPSPEIHLITGIDSLAAFLGCHYNTASNIYHSGVLDPATYRYNDTIIFNRDLVLDLLKVSGKKKVGKYKFENNR